MKKSKYGEKKGDYLITKTPSDKKILVKVLHTDSEGIKGRVEASKVENRRVSLDVERDTIIANLGQRPPFGTVYGTLVEPLLRTDDIENWGEIHFYRRLKKVEKKALRLAFETVWKKVVVKYKLKDVMPITFEVRHAKGRWAGFYRNLPKHECHCITLKPKGFLLDDTIELLVHELAHAIDCKLVPPKLKAKWIKLYTYYITLTTLKSSQIAKVREELEASGSIAEFKANLADDDAEEEDDKKKSKDLSQIDILDECLSYIQSNFNLRPREINLLLSEQESLEQYWPKHAMDIADATAGEAVMTEYGLTNADEFFAESFRLFIKGGAGKKITKLMKTTLKGLSPQGESDD